MASSSASFRIHRPTRSSHSASQDFVRFDLNCLRFLSSLFENKIPHRLPSNGYLRFSRDIVNGPGPTTHTRLGVPAGLDPHVARLASRARIPCRFAGWSSCVLGHTEPHG